MRLNDDKISDITFKMTLQLEKDDRAKFLTSVNVIRACIKRTIVSELQLEDEVIQIVLQRLEGMKSVNRDSVKWEGHFERLYVQEMAKRGRHWDIDARGVLR